MYTCTKFHAEKKLEKIIKKGSEQRTRLVSDSQAPRGRAHL